MAFLKTRGTRIVAACLVVLLLCILVVPLATRYALQSYLEKNGAKDAVISSFFLNPFTGLVRVKGVHVDGPKKRLLASSYFDVDIGLLSLFKRELVIETAYYDKLTIDLEQQDDGRWRIASYTTPELGDEVVKGPEVVVEDIKKPAEWNIIAHQVLMTDCVVDFATPEFSTQLVIKRAELKNFSTRAGDPSAQFTFAGSVGESPLTVSLEAFDFVPDFLLVGEIDFKNYELDQLQPLVAPYVQKIGGALSLKGSTRCAFGKETQNFSYTGALSLQKADLATTSRIIAGSSSWQGNIGYNAKESRLTVNGEVNLAELAYSGGKSVPTANLGSLTATVKGDYAAQKEHLSGGLEVDAHLVATDFTLSVPGETPLEARLGEVRITKLGTKADKIVLDKVDVGEIGLYSPLLQKDFLKVSKLLCSELVTLPGWFTTLSSVAVHGVDVFPGGDSTTHSASVADLNVSGLQWSKEDGTWLKRISANGLNLLVVRDKQGSFHLGKKVAALSTAQNNGDKVVAPAVADNQSAKAGIRIDRLELGGTNTVFYKDYTLEVPFESESEISSLVLTQLDSRKPQQDTTLAMEILLEKRSPLVLEGNLRPFQQGGQAEDFIKLDYSLKNYPIRNLSPYAVQNVGTALHSGELRLKGDFSLSKGIVDASNDLMLKRLTTKSVSPELAAKVDDKLPIPLDAALALLRDSEDNISLSLPIDGPVAELDFDVSDAVIIALGKAVVPAASSYLVYALGPYGALAYVGMKVGENILEVRLPPVKFEPTKVELTAESKDYLKRVGKIINDGKAHSDVQLCPVISLGHEFGDAAPQQEELDPETRDKLEILGQTRAQVVRDHLMTEYGVSKERLLLCITTIEEQGQSEVLLYAD